MSEEQVQQEKVLSLGEAAKLTAMPRRRLKDTLLRAHNERGNILAKIRNRWYITESSLRILFPYIFSNIKSKLENRMFETEERVSFLEKKQLEQKQIIVSLRNRVKELENK